MVKAMIAMGIRQENIASLLKIVSGRESPARASVEV